MKRKPVVTLNLFSTIAVMAGVIAIFCAKPVQAAGTTTWSGAGANQNWSTSGNWTTAGGSTPPAAGDAVLFRATGAQSNTNVNNIVDGSFGGTIASLQVTNEAANIFHTTQIASGTTLTVSGAILIGGTNNALTYTMTGGGTLKGGNGTSIYTAAGGNTSTVTNDLTGLNNFIWNAGGAGGAFNVGLDSGVSSAATMRLAAVSNSINATTIIIAENNSGGTGLLTLGAGTNNINANSMEIGDAKATGTLQFNGSTGGLRLRNAAGTGRTAVDVGGTPGHSGAGSSPGIGNIQLNGHTVDMMIGTLTLGNRAGRGSSGGSGANSAGSFSFNSGVVDVTNIQMAVSTSGGTNCAGTLSVGGGTLKVGTGGISMVNDGGNGVNPGKLIITNGGVVTCAGSIVKTTTAGTGTILITNSTLTLNSGSVTVGSSSTPIDAITLNNATLHLNLDANNSGTTTIVVTTLNTNGANNLKIDTIVNASGTVTFPLINYLTAANDPWGSFLSGSVTNLTLPNGYTGFLWDDTGSQTIRVTITAPTLFSLIWAGITNTTVLVSIWDTNRTADWVDANNTSSSLVYADGDSVQFDDTASTNVVTLVTTNAPGSLAFFNNSLNYLFNGAGKITGTTGLNKQGSGTLTLTESGGDDFTGGVIINSGSTVIFDNTNSAISGGLTINGGNTAQLGNNDDGGNLPSGTLDDEGTLIVSRAHNVTISSLIPGGGALTQNGNGTLTLSVSNSYSGVTTVSKGKLALTVANAISASSGVLVSNATLDVSAVSSPVGLNNLSLTNAAINLAASGSLLPAINVNTFESDGTTINSNIINLTALPGIAFYPSTITLIKSTNTIALAGGIFNFTLGTLPVASPSYAGQLSESSDGTSILLTLTAGPVGARTTVTWNGTNNVSADTNWSDNLNWQLPGIPVSTDSVFFNDQTTVPNSTTTNNVVDSGFGGTIGALTYSQIGNGYQNTFIPGGATLSVTGSGGLTVGSPAQLTSQASPVTTVSGTALVVNNVSANVNVGVGEPGTGGTATLNLTNLNTFNVTGARLMIGASGVNRATGVLYLAQTNKIALSGSAPQIDIGENTGNNGPGSALYLGQTNTIFADSIAMGRGKQNTSGGGVIRFNPAFTNNNPFAYFRGADGVSPIGTWAIADGINSGGTITDSGTSDFTGGTVDILVNAMWLGRNGTAASAGTSANNGTLTFSAGSIVVNNLTNGMIAATNQNPNVTGNVNVTGTGVLTVNNALMMAAFNNFNLLGPVAAKGTLSITNGTVHANQIISGGGTTIINVTDGTLVISNNAGTPGSPITTLNLNDSGAADTKLVLNPVAGSTNIYATTINASGTTTIDINSFIGVVGTAQVPLISYTGTDPYSKLALGVTPPGYTIGNGGLLVDNTGSQTIDIIVTQPGPTFWVGAVGSTPNSSWDFTTTDWNNGSAVAYVNTFYAQFDDTASNSTVTLNVPAVAPTSLDVSNNVLNYVINGAGKITGPIPLLKQGVAKLTLDNTVSNDFFGGVNILGGTLQVGNNDANGNLPVTGGIIDNGTLVLSRTDGAIIPNLISGSGGLTQNGTGTNKLTAFNSYAGTTIISSGMISVTNANGGNSGIGAAAGACYVTNGGTLDIENGTAQALSFTNTTDNGGKQFFIAGAGVGGNGAIVNNGTANQQDAIQYLALTANATVGGPGRWDLRVPNNHYQPILDLGGFTLTKTGTNQMSMVSLIVTNGGSIVINNGIFSFETLTTNSGTAITINAGGVMGHFREAGGYFTAPITLNGGMIRDLNGAPGCTNDSPITLTANSFLDLNVGSTDLAQLNGIISESGGSFGLTKTNIGTFALTATETYSGPTAIVQGRLLLSGNGSIGSSKSLSVSSGAVLDASQRSDQTLTLNSGQTLGGAGSVTGFVATASGSTIAPGTSSAIGTLTLNNNTTLAGTNLFKLNKTVSPSNDVLSVNGTLAYGGVLTVQNLGGTYVVGDTFKIYNATGGASGTFSATNFPSLGGGLGLSWNPATATLSVVQTVVTTPTNIMTSVSGNVLTLSWPSDHTGWYLQAQTNSLSQGLGTNWVDVPNSSTMDSVNVNINPANGTVFYRLSLNP